MDQLLKECKFQKLIRLIQRLFLLSGKYKNALDKNYFYKEQTIIEGFIQNKTKLKLNRIGWVIEMKFNDLTFIFEMVD
jgi:hypothetical protein